MAHSIRIDSESNEYESVSVVADTPTWRDCWKIVRGTYRPTVRRETRLTLAGHARLLKQTWTSEKMTAMLYDSSPLLKAFGQEDNT